MLFLCDTGADHNIISRRMVPNAKLTETSIDLYTASGQRLHVLGKVWLHFSINGMLFDSEFLVTDQLSDAILGFQFMNDFGCEWRFKQRMIVINGVDVKLVRKPSKANVRRVYARERVSLAPDSRANIPVKMCFNSLRANPGNWLMDSKELRPGVLISRCLLPDVDTYAAVQVMNLSGKHQVFHEGLCMGDAESASVLKVGEEGPAPSFGAGQFVKMDASETGQFVRTNASETKVTPLGGLAQPEISGVWEPERVRYGEIGGEAPGTLEGGLNQHLRKERSKASALYSTVSSSVSDFSDVEVFDLSESVRPYFVRQSVLRTAVRTSYGTPYVDNSGPTEPREAVLQCNAVDQLGSERPYDVRTSYGMQISCGEQLGQRGHVVTRDGEAGGAAGQSQRTDPYDVRTSYGMQMSGAPSDRLEVSQSERAYPYDVRTSCGMQIRSAIDKGTTASLCSVVKSCVETADVAADCVDLCSLVDNSKWLINDSSGDLGSDSSVIDCGLLSDGVGRYSEDVPGLSRPVGGAPCEGRRSEYSHLQCIVDSLPAAITVSERNCVIDLLNNYHDIFSVSEFDVGCTDVLTASILTGDHPPIAQSLRRYPRAHLDLIDKTIDGWCQSGVCSESVSAWNFNIVLVNRPGNAVPRITLDLRALNNVSYKDKFPLPKIRDCLDALAGNVYFSCLDISNSFNNI